MNRFRLFLSRLMQGRYGVDEFNRFLITVTMVIIVLRIFIRIRILDIITLALLIYIYCRMFSRNMNARYRENQKFLQHVSRFRAKHAGGMRSRPARDREHRVLRCPGCGERLRVPRGAGKINITCPHCGLKFMKKV